MQERLLTDDQSDAKSSTVRIRENQRRSRMRRAELVQSLQERVKEYERQGVSATLEMQRAARKVAQDNARLRQLLARHGVSSEEVEQFLRSPELSSDPEAPLFAVSASVQDVQASNEKDTDSFCTTESLSQTQIRHGDLEDARPDLSRSKIAAGNHDLGATDCLQPSACNTQTKSRLTEVVTTFSDTHGQAEPSANNHPYRMVECEECPSSLDCFCAPHPVSESRPSTSSGLKISCEAAAAVIAGMRGDLDRELIRASLGCRGQESCTVKNSTVFQLMDEG